tara:strand:+ start:3008 stop:3175 length:168 start_codon:yes stop_codon:yes gene_type:complete
MKTRDQMIRFIADEYVDNIDIKNYLRQQHLEYTDEMNEWSDEEVIDEYNKISELE